MLTQRLNIQTQNQGETFLTPWNLGVHLPVPGTCLLCHQRPSATLPVVACHVIATGDRMEQAICCIAPLLWTRKGAGRLSRTSEEDRGAACVSACSFTFFLAKTLLLLKLQHSLWHEVSVPAQLPAPV